MTTPEIPGKENGFTRLPELTKNPLELKRFGVVCLGTSVPAQSPRNFEMIKSPDSIVSEEVLRKWSDPGRKLGPGPHFYSADVPKLDLTEWRYLGLIHNSRWTNPPPPQVRSSPLLEHDTIQKI